MTTLFNKYRYLFFLLVGAYLNFSLLLPVFHHHHEEESGTLGKQKYHSHLLNDLHPQNEEQHTDFHSVEDVPNHNHFVNLNLVETGKVKRILFYQITHVVLTFTGIEESKTKSKFIIETKPKDNLDRERYVLSAANVSPPLV